MLDLHNYIHIYCIPYSASVNTRQTWQDARTHWALGGKQQSIETCSTVAKGGKKGAHCDSGASHTPSDSPVFRYVLLLLMSSISSHIEYGYVMC